MLVFQFGGYNTLYLPGIWNFEADTTIVFNNSRFYEIILWGRSKILSKPQLNSKLNTASNKLN